MTYELAKELKNAGYPQEVRNGWYYNPQDHKECVDAGITLENVYIPTLSELIEACGEEFETLTNTHKRAPWVAVGRDGLEYGMGGSTPGEAVARLWLALKEHGKE
jgi:hypothetical protein